LSVQKLRPDSFGAPRALATYNGILGDFDAIADWLSKAIGQHDPAILSMLRLWYGRDLRNQIRVAVETCAIPALRIVTKRVLYTPIMVIDGALYEWRVTRPGYAATSHKAVYGKLPKG
jgi:hypothetical protein